MFMVKIPLEIAPLHPSTSLDSPSTLFEPLLLITHAASVSCRKKLRNSNKVQTLKIVYVFCSIFLVADATSSSKTLVLISAEFTNQATT
jgi:hypothetical protein